MNTNGTSLAVIIPVYNEGSVIYGNISKIQRIFLEDGISCRFMIVDDGSTDHTWSELSRLSEEYDNIFSIKFSRNFGKENAIFAGIENIEADRYLIMDSDLQHPPKCVKEMLSLMVSEQADIVDGIKKDRGTEKGLYRFFANCFYRVLKLATGLRFENSSDFKIMDKSVVNTLRKFEESSLFFRGLVAWVGFKKVPYYFSVDDRAGGATRFSTRKLIKLSVNAVLSFTSKPLYVIIFFGMMFLFFAIILGIETLCIYFSGKAISGFSTVILLLLLLGSMIMLSLGVIGVYISRIYDEIKGRPRYIVSEKTDKRQI